VRGAQRASQQVDARVGPEDLVECAVLAKEVNQQRSTSGTNGTLTLKDVIRFYSARFPDKKDREIARIFGTNHTTVGRYRKG